MSGCVRPVVDLRGCASSRGSGMPLARALIAGGLCALFACTSPGIAAAPPSGPLADVEAISLFGEPLRAMPMDDADRATREADLADSVAALEGAPDDETAIIWHGRRLAYLGRYRDAIDAFSRGLAKHPDSYRLLRHRGHRYVTTRRFDEAVADLSRAAGLVVEVPDDVEADGMPNAAGVPTSTTKTNIFYHLALAEYLRGEFDAAANAWQTCLELAKNDDMRCAASYWLYLARRRAGDAESAVEVLAPIHAEMTIRENHTYHRLLLLFKGELEPAEIAGDEDSALGPAIDDATVGYGLGAWHWLAGREDEARTTWQRVLAGPGWPAFGFIAAEAEMARE